MSVIKAQAVMSVTRVLYHTVFGENINECGGTYPGSPWLFPLAQGPKKAIAGPRRNSFYTQPKIFIFLL